MKKLMPLALLCALLAGCALQQTTFTYAPHISVASLPAAELSAVYQTTAAGGAQTAVLFADIYEDGVLTGTTGELTALLASGDALGAAFNAADGTWTFAVEHFKTVNGVQQSAGGSAFTTAALPLGMGGFETFDYLVNPEACVSGGSVALMVLANSAGELPEFEMTDKTSLEKAVAASLVAYVVRCRLEPAKPAATNAG